MKTGVVKFFDSRDNKRFGFITIDGVGGDIFFHFNDGDKFAACEGYNEPCLAGGRLEREPRKGDRVVFEALQRSRGPIAVPWGFADDYERAKKEIAARPAPAIYRVMRRTTVCGNPPDQPEVLWQGNNLENLCKKYPRTIDRRCDDLSPTFSCDDFSQSTWFERQTDTGWERCDDPRPIEHVNRRR